MSTDLETNLGIIEEFTQRLQVAVIGAEETTAKHVEWVEGPVDGTIPTANGPLKTLRGQIAEWRQAADQDVDSAISGYDVQFAAALVQFQTEFEEYLLTVGFEPGVEYSAGILIERRSQTVIFDGVTYYWVGTLPYTTTGSFITETSWQIAPITGGIETPTFNFAAGGKLLRKSQSVLGLDGEWYYWTGTFPKTVPPASTLESAGGVGENLFKLASGFPPLRPSLAVIATSIGLELNSGSFESGATLIHKGEILVQFLTGRMYKWNGTYPKVVDPFSTPSSSGGINSTGWIEIEKSFNYNLIFESLRRSYAEARYTLAIGTFESGGIVVSNSEVLLYGDEGKAYSWGGPFPKTVPVGSTPDSSGGVGINGWTDRSNALLRSDIPFVSPEMYGAGSIPTPNDTQPLIDAFTAAKAMGVSVKLSRLYRCSSNISLSSFISDVFGLGQGQTGIIFEPGFGFVVDNSAITGTRKAMRFINTSLRTRGNLDATALKFKGTSSAKYGEQLKLTDVLFATDETGAFGWDCCVELDTASQVFMDHCSMSGLSAVPTNCCIRLKNSSRDVNFTNGCASDFTQFMDLTSSSEGVTVAFNHIIAGRRGIVSHDTGGNMVIVIGNHFNTSLSAVELGEGTGGGSNHCKISDNFCIVFNHPLDASAPYVGFDICSNYNQLTANEVLLTGFTKPNVIHTRLRGNTSGTRFATANTVANPLMNALSQGVVVAAGATGNQIHGSLPVGMTLANTIVDSGTNTRYWMLDSDLNSLLTGDIKMCRVGATGTRQIRAFTSGDSAVADGVLRFLGGTAGVANEGIAEFTFKETVTKLLRPSVGNTYTCGASGAPWSGGFTQTAFTVTSDENYKTKPLVITDAMLDAAAEVDWVMYQYLDRVEMKGPDGARWHFGAIAQRYVHAFANHGLNAHDFGFICYDEWKAEPEVVEVIPAVIDENGIIIEPECTEVIRPAIEAGSRYGIRYEEALALEAAYQRRRNDRIEARLAILEETQNIAPH